MTETITIEKARDALLRAVATQGREFIYNPGGEKTCLYRKLSAGEDMTQFHTSSVTDIVEEGDPRTVTPCLIGTALHLLGAANDSLLNSTSNVFGLWENHIIHIDPEARDYFTKAQQYQDSGKSWGEAFDAAEARYRDDH